MFLIRFDPLNPQDPRSKDRNCLSIRLFVIGDRLFCTFVAADGDLFSRDRYFYSAVRDLPIADGTF